MSKTNKILAVIAVSMLTILLLATNPSRQEFKEHLKNELNDAAKNEGGVASVFSGITSEMSVWAAEGSINKWNCLLFSSFSLTINSKKYIYVGGLNHFIRLN